jgi:Na+-driven multidrug efflux pump
MAAQRVRERDPRHRQHAAAGAHDLLGVVVLVPLSPVPDLRAGPVSRLGIAGAGSPVVATTALTARVLGWYLWSGRALVRPRRARLRWAMFADILHVGAVGTISTVQTTLHGGADHRPGRRRGRTGAVAGYGTGSRLDTC